ncbi:MAG TPA: aminotransferase class I/II-fold pyridoxal phosphate-dependent enzyme [Myxococcales bacterium]|nr:aminotransferase class I/II-fold pyridoxal phosphate-dependent enzyme [Myxococcales bacterium]
MISVHLSPPHLGAEERALLNQALDSNWVAPLGPQVDAFEAEVAAEVGASHAVALSSGTAALHLSLVLLGIGRGDEVWTSTFTFAATANPVTYVGARPVFLDVRPDTWTLDPGLLEEALARAARRGRLPRAVIAVDLYGQCADYEPIQALCRRYGVALVEDAAEALGARYRGRAAGTLGDLGVYSFNGNKIITTSGGGMLICERAAQAERARFLAAQARDPAPHYQHSQIGFNYRMSNLLAAVGRGQLRVLPQRVEARRRVNAFYREALRGVPGISFQPEAKYGSSNCWLTCIQVDPEQFGATRDDVRAALESAGVESRPVWKPLHLQPAFSDCTFVGSGVSEALFERGLCLPSGSALSPADLERIAERVRSCGRES